jgi:hypothetical protein
VIQVGPGEFTENGILTLKSGVSLIGAGSGKTRILVNHYFSLTDAVPNANPHQDTFPDHFILQVEGNHQTLKGFSLDGQEKRCHGGIFAARTSQVVFEDLEVTNFRYCGLWVIDAHDTTLRFSRFKNNTYGNPNRGDSGAVQYRRGRNLTIHDNRIEETGSLGPDIGGYAMKAQDRRYSVSASNVLEGFKMYNNVLIVPSNGAWEKGIAPAFAAEFLGMALKNCDIHHNLLNGTLSLAGPALSGEGIRIHHNYFNIGRGRYGYCVEGNVSNTLISDRNNQICACRGSGFRVWWGMARARWIVPWADSETKPAIYHCMARVVDKRFAFEPDDKEQFRIHMRMMENFSGCRVLAYCVMSNHFHLLLEVPPRPKGGLGDEQLLKRLGGLYPRAFVAAVAQELADAREVVAQGLAADGEEHVRRIHERFTYRMHDLSEFMKTLLQRFTRWHNNRTKRCGNLWEETFKSVVVEDGLASKTMAAYIDLNPVRAGMVTDPAEYRWSSYGEAMGATGKSGAKAKAGLVRAIMADRGWEADARHWSGRISREYRMALLEGGEEKNQEEVNEQGERVTRVVKRGMKNRVVSAELERLSTGRDVALRRMLRWKVRYFTDGAVVGSRAFVEGFFSECRERFGAKRKSGARKMRGKAAGAADLLWTARDLRVGVD